MINISIIIPIYNVEKYIERCLQSVLNQTYKGTLECILVNDCTPDESIRIVERIILYYNGPVKLKLIHHKLNRGLSAARNTGIEKSTGDYLFFLDSDDELPINSMNFFFDYLETYGMVDCLMGNFEIKGRFAYQPFQSTIYLKSRDKIFNEYINSGWYVMASGKLINRAFLMKTQLYFEEGLLHEDELFSFQLALKANSMVCFPEIIYRYFIRENSITGHKSYKNYKDYLLIICKNLNFIKTDNSLIKKLPIGNYFTSVLYGFTLSIINNKYLKKCEKKGFIKEVRVLIEHTDSILLISGFKSHIEYLILHLHYILIKPIMKIHHLLIKLRY